MRSRIILVWTMTGCMSWGHTEGGVWTVDAYDMYVEKNRERFIGELQSFVRQPSVAAQNLGMKEMADRVCERLDQVGVKARIVPVAGGNPVIYGEIGSGAKNLLIYDHYDVQPAEPLELWDTPPWEGAIRDGKMYARGVAHTLR
jgi:acetylornithine deacetylase/succinyl-diaminopimelate desuccinylase-like protein